MAIPLPQSSTALARSVRTRIPMVCWPLAATLAVQCHVLFYGFLFDDFVHLYTVSNRPFWEAVSVPMGGHLIHSLMAIMWLLKSLFGLNPLAYLAFGLLVHLVNVWLLFGIISRLTGRPAMAAFGASLWGMSPLVAGTIGWISAHGHGYATAAVLWVLYDIVRCSQRPAGLGNALLVRHAVLLLVATTSFGTGLVATVVFPFLVWLWNPLPLQRFKLVAVYSAVALLAVTVYLITMQLQGDARDNLGDKVDIVSQGIANLPSIMRAFLDLFSVGSAVLLLGPLLVGGVSVVPAASVSVVAKLTTVVVVVPLLLWGCWVSTATERRRLIALLLLACAAYGVIALARSGGLLPFNAEASRYHYMAPALLAVVCSLLLCKLLDRFPAAVPGYGRTPYFVWLALVIVPFTLGPVSVVKEVQITRQNNQLQRSTLALEKALQNHSGTDDIYIRNRPFAVFAWGYTPQHFPGLAALFIISYPDNSFEGKRVIFLDDSEELVQSAQAQHGTRIAELLQYRPK